MPEEIKTVEQLIDALRRGTYTRLSGGGTLFDFSFDRNDAEKIVRDFLKTQRMKK